MNASKDKGTLFETACVNYLRAALGDARIDRQALKGTGDEGDIAGVYFRGLRVVVECKNAKRLSYAAWWGEVMVEMGNADTSLGVVFAHRPRVGFRRDGSGVGRQLAFMGVGMLRNLGLSEGDCRLETIPRHKGDLYGMSVEDFTLILNSGLPLGPDDERTL